MPKPVANIDDEAADARVYPDMPNYAADDAAFRKAVQKGIEGAKVGPNRDLDTVAAEIRRALLSR